MNDPKRKSIESRDKNRAVKRILRNTSFCPADVSKESKIIRKIQEASRVAPKGIRNSTGVRFSPSFDCKVEEKLGEKMWNTRGENERRLHRELSSLSSRSPSSPSCQLLSNKVNVYFSSPSSPSCSIPPPDARQITRDHQLWETLTVTRLRMEKGRGGREKMWNCWDRSCRFVEENRLRGAWEEFFFPFSFSRMKRLWSWKGNFLIQARTGWPTFGCCVNILGCIMELITLPNGYDLLFKRSFSWIKVNQNYWNFEINRLEEAKERIAVFDRSKFRILRNENWIETPI